MPQWDILALVLVVLSGLYLLKRPRHRYPPGPRGIPILGNALQLDTVKPWHTFTKWGKVYGPITYLNVAGQSMVILNSKKAAEDLLVGRSSKYCDRHRFIVLEETTGNSNIAFIRPGERWRKMRRATDHAMGIKASSNFRRTQANESIILAHGILNEADLWRSHVERTSSSIALSMIYDKPPLQSLDDPSVVFMNSFVDRIAKVAIPGNYIVDILPILEKLPLCLSQWKQEAQREFKRFTSRFEEMFLEVKKKVASGHEQYPSFCVTLSENQTKQNMSDSDCAWLAGALYSAGHETTATTMLWFIFSMILFPETQKRAQDELDRVVGSSRLPSFSDLKHLPYIQAILKEILRWRPAVPTGLPHIPIEDDFYDGYFIPKGTMCIPCIWAINRDPDVYGLDGDNFRPERHLDQNSHLKDETNEGHVTYGFGQRTCAGRYVANNSLFIQMATVLWTMKLEPLKDSKGQPVVPDVDAEEANGIFTRPPPFQFTASPRFPDSEALIQQARDEIMQEVLSRPEVL
ncbi:hypothetical protein D9758_004547 [Tetrapyrgos nigripes]|uniref:Cytochrome P450 n=1 Tax=Tetrapyrgos nigripes TaxID=182062 RepID=A0A8H5LY64_9AGAR|nr:hypothetical protein D9758_004547 [Tetrapyrgos nigripes]